MQRSLIAYLIILLLIYGHYVDLHIKDRNTDLSTITAILLLNN